MNLWKYFNPAWHPRACCWYHKAANYRKRKVSFLAKTGSDAFSLHLLWTMSCSLFFHGRLCLVWELVPPFRNYKTLAVLTFLLPACFMNTNQLPLLLLLCSICNASLLFRVLTALWRSNSQILMEMLLAPLLTEVQSIALWNLMAKDSKWRNC